MTFTPIRTRAYRAPASARWHAVDDAAQTSYTQGALALTYPLDGGLDAIPQAGSLRLIGDRPGQQTTAPDAEQWATRFVQAVVEVVSCERPLSQLARWTDAEVYVDLGRRRDQVARHRKPGQVRSHRQQVASVHVWQPAYDVAEVAARVTTGARSRAIAARLQFERGRWLCTTLTFG